MASDSVKVAVRIRPQNVREQTAGYKLCTSVSKTAAQISIGSDKRFTYDYVYDCDTSQAQVYDSCIRDLVDGVFNGLNATVLAYGQTGSGKTHTMGTAFDAATVTLEHIGIIPRSVEQIFTTIAELKKQASDKDHPEPTFAIEVQFIELYNEELIDLLTVDRSVPVRIHEDADSGQIVIKNATKVMVNNTDEILNILRNGALNRTTGSTNMNQQSSRSHAIFSIHVKQEKVEAIVEDDKVFAVLSAKLHFVDLAGSERLKRTGATGDRAKEGISINGGLLALGNVIYALTDSKKSHVPYRDSKLTRLLQDSLGGNSRTLMIACASPNVNDLAETLSTLNYAARAKSIQNHVAINKNYETSLVVQLKARIATLEAELNKAREAKQQVVVEKVKQVEEEPADLVESFKQRSTSVLEKFERRVHSSLGNKPEIDSLVLAKKELLELVDQFRDGLESHLHVLQIPSRSTTRRERRDTIFGPRTRNGTHHKRVTTLFSNKTMEDVNEENAVDNVENMYPEMQEDEIADERYKQLQNELLASQKQVKQLEDACKHVTERSESNVLHLTNSLSSLKQELAQVIAARKTHL